MSSGGGVPDKFVFVRGAEKIFALGLNDLGPDLSSTT